MFLNGGIGPHLGRYWGFENVNFGPLYFLTSLGGPTPDLTREHYSPGVFDTEWCKWAKMTTNGLGRLSSQVL